MQRKSRGARQRGAGPTDACMNAYMRAHNSVFGVMASVPELGVFFSLSLQ